MAVDTKPNLSNCKFEQYYGDLLNLSGCTAIYGDFQIECGATLHILPNAGLGKYFASDEFGNGTWQNFGGITGATNGLQKSGQNIILGGGLITDTSIVTNGNPFSILGLPAKTIETNVLYINELGILSSGTTSGTISGGTNGICIDGGNSKLLTLGGNLTGAVNIDACGNSINLHNGYINTDYYAISGYTALKTNTNSLTSIYVGFFTGQNTGGTGNVGVGYESLCSLTIDGNDNIGIGRWALREFQTGSNNIGIGNSAGLGVQSGDYNVAIGFATLFGNNNTCNNTAIGSLAGYNSTSTGNTFIGYHAGNGEYQNDRLHIGTRGDIRPSLIGGSFTLKCVDINGALKITDVTDGDSYDSILTWNPVSCDVRKVPYSSGVGTISGATNGLNVQGKNIALGGFITEQTNINIDSLGSNLIITGATSSGITGNSGFGLSIINWDGERVNPRVSIGNIKNSGGASDKVYLNVDESGVAMSSCYLTCRGCFQVTPHNVTFGTQNNTGTTVSQFIAMSQSNCQMRLYVSCSTSGCKAELCLGLGYMKICGGKPMGFPGVEYDSDYSANYTNRSLVDKAYVLAQMSGGSGGGTITGATNGLCTYGKNIGLGGTLTGTTTINSANNGFSICNSTEIAQCFYFGSSGNMFIQGADGFGSYCSRAVWDGDILLRSECLFCDANIKICGSTSLIQMTVSDGFGTHPIAYFNPSGLTYNSNFASCNTKNPRWIPDKAYVTGLTSAFGTPITGATNLGSGNGTIYTSTSDKKLQLKTLSGGTNVTLTCNGNYIAINASGGPAFGWSNITKGSTVAGCATIASGSTLCNSTYYGVCAGGSTVTGRTNIAIGTCSLYNLTCGSGNTAMGYRALQNNNRGCNNVIVGHEAAYYPGCGCGNVALGYQAFRCNGYGVYNIAIGHQANLGIGPSSGGNHNIALGYQALMCSTSGSANIAIGCQALLCNINGDQNIALGPASLGLNTSGMNNVGLGYYTLGSNSTGCNGIAIGWGALGNNTTGCNSIALGYRTLLGGGRDNIAMGYESMRCNTSGSGNTAMGCNALICNTSGCHNIAIGLFALSANTSSCGNIALGFEALRRNTGGYNIAIGCQALCKNTGSHNIALGLQALGNNTSGQQDVAIGQCALATNNTGTENTAVGAFALYSNSSGCDNSAFGKSALLTNSIGRNNTAMGAYSLQNNSSGTGNTAMGYFAMNGNGTYHNGIGIGICALGSGGQDSVALGYHASARFYGQDSVAIGYSALCGVGATSFGAGNIAIGRHALTKTTDGSNNIAFGSCTLCGNTSGTNNFGVGYWTLCGNSNGTNNIAIGYRSMVGNTGSSNIVFGAFAGNSMTTANYNIVIGYGALTQNNGSNNIAIGCRAGLSNISGTGNTFIGMCAGYNATTSNKLYIDNTSTATPLIYGEFDNDCVIINSVLKSATCVCSPIIVASTCTLSPKFIENGTCLESKYLPFTMTTDWQDPTGFVDGSNINVAYNYANRTITLTGNLDYYWKGVKKTLTSPWTSAAHTNTVGIWFLYSTDGTNFAWSNSVWNFTDVMVALVNYKSTSGTTFAIRETHGMMLWSTHQDLHKNIGTYLYSGGVATSWTANTATDAANSPNFGTAVIADEDNQTTISGITKGDYTLMQVSAGTNVYTLAHTQPFIAGGTNQFIQVNDPITGSMTPGINARYYNVYQILIPTTSDSTSQKFRTIFLQPQATYVTLATAQAEDSRGLYLGGLAGESNEFIPYARITYLTANANNNYGKVTIPTNGISYVVGNRMGSTSMSGIASPNNHVNLTNLNWTSSGHVGTNNTLAAFDGSGNATEILVSTVARYCQFTISGNSTATGFTVNHGLSNQFVSVQIAQDASPYATIYTTVQRPNTSCVCVTFDTAPTTGTNYKVLVTG